MTDPSFDPADKALLDQAVRGMQDDLPDDARMRRLERLIAPTLVAPLAPERWWTRGPMRAIAGVAVVVAIGGALLTKNRGTESPHPVETPAPISAPEAAPAVVPVTPVVSIDSLPAAAPEVPRPAVEATAKRASEAPRSDPPAAAEDPGDELALLEDARRSLDTDPARSLALADTHAKRFRRPALAQERERLAIEALVRLGRRDEASSRARAFEATYPDSAHLARVRALVSSPPPGGAP